MASTEQPSARQSEDLDGFAEALYELLQERALSLGIVDIALELDGWFIDVEVLFAVGPDMGISLHGGAGESRFCQLVGEQEEQWLDHHVDGVKVIGVRDADALRGQALRVLQGLLDARRPLLNQD